MALSRPIRHWPLKEIRNSSASAMNNPVRQRTKVARNVDRLLGSLKSAAGPAADGETIGELTLQVLQRRGAGGAGVEQADLDAALGEATEDVDDGRGAALAELGDEHRFKVRRHQVDADAGGEDAVADDLL